MSYNEQIQKLLFEYEKTLGGKPLNPREAAYHFIKNGKWKLPVSKEVDALVKDIGKALRTSYLISPDGKRIRRKHCVRYKDQDGSGKQLYLWWDIDLAPPNFMMQSLEQRRSQFADGIYQAVKDKDYYNKYKNKAASLEFFTDFTEDVEERATTEELPFSEDEDSLF